MSKFQTCVRVALRSALTLATAVSLSFALGGAKAADVFFDLIGKADL